jgi:hypothetical protein
MTFESLAPTGKIVKGHVLDVNKAALERKLQDYDNLLYVKWNPNKRSGHGCWEVRRRPTEKTAMDKGTFGGVHFIALEDFELDIVHHVLDVPFLNYDAVAKVKSMDTWGTKDWVSELDYKRSKYEENIQAKAKDDLRYSAKEYKKEIREFRELLLSGMNPASIARHWGK